MNKKSRVIFVFSFIFYLITSFIIVFESFQPGASSSQKSNTVNHLLDKVISIFVPEKHDFVSVTSLELKEPLNDIYYVGDTFSLNVSVLPTNASNQSLIYHSSNPEIASISTTGEVSILEKGSVNFKIQSSNENVFLDFNLISTFHQLESIEIDDSTYNQTIVEGIPFYLDFKTHPKIIDNSKITYEYDHTLLSKSTNEPNKWIPKKSSASASIIIKCDEIKKEFKFSIQDSTSNKANTISKIECDIKEKYLNKEEFELPITFLPKDAYNQNLIVEVSNQDKLTYLGKNKFYPEQNGDVSISIYSELNPEIKLELDLIIYNHIDSPTFNADFIKLDEECALIAGNNYKIEVDFTDTSTYTNYTLSSSNEEVFTVSQDGNICALESGNSKLICEVDDGSNQVVIELQIKVYHSFYKNRLNTIKILIRKLFGHFSLFLVNGIFASLLFYNLFKNKITSFIVTIISGFILAAGSEIIQTFVPLRYGNIKDVGIDLLGYFSFSLTFYAIIYFVNKQKNIDKKLSK